MQPLSAEILTQKVIGDQRSVVRRSLRLGVSATSSGDVAMALILNISETGLLIETVVELAVGETLQVDIPEARASTARVVWTEGLLAGCEFADPVSTGAVSAAQLRSSIAARDASHEGPAFGPDLPQGAEPGDYEESSIQTAIFIVMALISALALLIFLAAVIPL